MMSRVEARKVARSETAPVVAGVAQVTLTGITARESAVPHCKTGGAPLKEGYIGAANPGYGANRTQQS